MKVLSRCYCTRTSVLLITFSLLASLIISQPSFANDKKVYKFGVVPQFEPRKLAAIWLPILEELSARTGLEFTMVGSSKISAFETSFQSGEFDFAYMNPYHSVLAMEAQGYIPLVRDGSRRLKGVLVVRKDSPYTSVSQLNGKNLVFPAPNALGASLIIRADLTNLKGLTFNSTYVQTHSSVYHNVVLDQADAGGGVMGTLKAQNKDIQNSLRVLYTTREMSPHPITAHPRVTENVITKVKEALLAMAKTDTGRKMLQKVPIRGLIEANVNDYMELREWGLEEFYVK